MEALGLLLILLLVLLVVVLPITAIMQAAQARRGTEALEGRFRDLEAKTSAREEQWRRRIAELEGSPPRQVEVAASNMDGQKAGLGVPETTSTVLATHPAEVSEPQPSLAPAPSVPPPLPPIPLPTAEFSESEVATAEELVKAARAALDSPKPPAVAREPAFTLEQFMGVKLFAWIGGLALFLGVVFFVKLSIERGWIPAELRTMIGYVTGLALVGSGVWLNAKKTYAVLGQTLCATGTVVLYGMTYVAHAYYKFPVLASPLAAFALMTLITAGAFLLAVRMDAQVVAVLGMIGGFLTPILCSTGQDDPLGLFGYIALLDIGVLAVAKRRRWLYLTALAAAGTVFMQYGWVNAFFIREGYAQGTKTWVAVTVFLGFAALFTAAAWWTRRSEDEDRYPAGAAFAASGSAMLAAFVFLAHDSIADRPVLLYTFVLLINLIAMAAAWKEPRLSHGPVLIGFASFLHLALWTTAQLTAELLPHALVVYLLFGLMHTSYGVLWQRRHPNAIRDGASWVPVTTLILMLLPVLRLESVSLILWPALLVVDLAVIAMAFLSRTMVQAFAALLLTLFTTLCWLFKLPTTSDASLTLFLCVLGGFAIVFAVASCVLAQRVASDGSPPNAQSEARLLTASSAVLPFALLILAMLHLRVANPSPVFALALLLDLFLLELGRITRMTALAMAGLICTFGLEVVWHGQNFNPQHPWQPLLWYLAFHALFTLHPHVFRKHLVEKTTPWAASALAGVGAFWLVHPLVKETWPNDWMGLLPLAFAAPPLLGLLSVQRLHRADNPARMSQLAWFGGAALLFITLVFPIQFEKEWLTVSWAFEGAALCWLFRRVPHPGLRATGAALLAIAFVRLLNPVSFTWHVRGDVPVWNWQLYTYTLVAGSQFVAAWLLHPPRHLLGGINLRGLFGALGGILLFLLLNIEIADAFTPAGSRTIILDFSGNFARDMTYSIAWGLFALALIGIGFALRSKYTRYAGIGLLGATLLKLFLHDLSSLDSVYRIGALIVVALTALAASFLYQRFTDRSAEPGGKV